MLIRIAMGDIPSQGNTVSAIIVSPAPGENLAANQDFKVEVQTANLVAGSFTNPQNTYYAAPQKLQGGKIVGHCHITIQSLGNSLNPKTPPDGAKFEFFKGIDDAGNNQGLLTATVTGGLPAGNYRICTMNSASNHQPVLSSIAQRGSQDDCTKVTVGAANAGNGGNGGNQGQNNQGNGGNQGNQGQGQGQGNAGQQTGVGNQQGQNGGQQQGQNGGQQQGQNAGQQQGQNGGQQQGQNGGQQGQQQGQNGQGGRNGGRRMKDKSKSRFAAREFVV